MSDDITFYSARRPALLDGNYTITVTQTTRGIAGATSLQAHTQEFSVCGPRFLLDSQEIHAQYPPEGSVGIFDNVVPHIALNRCTLPWERSAAKDVKPSPPWLALLVIDESEDKDVTSRAATVGDLKKMPAGEWFPTLEAEYGDGGDTEPIRLLRVPVALLPTVLPTLEELPFTAHARSTVLPKPNEQAPTVTETFSIVIASRLPKNGSKCTVYLVSLEGHYSQKGLADSGTAAFRSFIVLTSWHFTSLAENQDFAGLLKGLNRGPLTLPVDGLKNETTRSQLNSGYTAIPHQMRQGNASVSWYRGPLLPGNPPTSASAPGTDPIHHSDELVRLEKSTALLDVTYAAAWELGKLLMLADQRASLDMFHWKRTHAKQLKDAANALEHLPQSTRLHDDLDFPESTANWLYDTSLLKDVPFSYLVPDERMLPAESIRFFQLDSLWIKCLLDGALTVGFVKGDYPAPPRPDTDRHVTGFLLRSSVISGWPQMKINCWQTEATGKEDLTQEAKIIRIERLSKSILLVLCEGMLRTVDFHLVPERLHFGFSKNDQEDPSHFTREIRDPDGNETNKSISAHVDATSRKIQLKALTDDMATNGVSPLNSASFAMEMIEGVERVRFVVGL